MLRKLLSIRRYPEFAQLLWWRVITPFMLRRAGLEIGSGTQFLGSPIVSLAPASRIKLGNRISLCSVSGHTALGVNHPVILRTLRYGAYIEIGNDTGISGGSICAELSVIIGNECLFGANVLVADTDFHALKPINRRHNNRQEDIGVAPVRIGNNVFLGTGVTVLKGVSIGDNTVIGANSVVTNDIPANSIAVGNPARVIRQIQN